MTPRWIALLVLLAALVGTCVLSPAAPPTAERWHGEAGAFGP